MVNHSGLEWLSIQWVTVTLYLREQIAKRLQHGLSETILVNILTDFREFKIYGAFNLLAPYLYYLRNLNPYMNSRNTNT